MKILFASVQCSERKFNELFRDSLKKPGQQVQKYDRLLAEGLSAQPDIKVCSLSDIPVTDANCGKRWIPRESEQVGKQKYYYPGTLNIHRWKDILTVFQSFFFCIHKCKAKDWIFLCDVLCAPVSLGALLAAKLRKKKIYGIVTDVPDILFETGDRVYHMVSNFIIQKCTGYILLTEQMNELINMEKKPYIVVEGITDGALHFEKTEVLSGESRRKICMYTGTLDRKYGIDLLVKGFVKADISDAELHIYGDGNFRDSLEYYTKQYPNIQYFGERMNDEIIIRQKQAALLINPRPSFSRFTKYSFPSKNIEYMASGTPMMAVSLAGIPKEYDTFYYPIEVETVEGVASAIRKVMNLDEKDRRMMGDRAKAFVLKEKNKYRQAERVAEFLKNQKK